MDIYLLCTQIDAGCVAAELTSTQLTILTQNQGNSKLRRKTEENSPLGSFMLKNWEEEHKLAVKHSLLSLNRNRVATLKENKLQN